MFLGLSSSFFHQIQKIPSMNLFISVYVLEKQQPKNGARSLEFMLNLKTLVFLWILTRHIKYSSQSSSINWLLQIFFFASLLAHSLRQSQCPSQYPVKKMILLKVLMTASYFFLTALLGRCSWFKMLTEKGSLHIHFWSLSYKSLFWEELKAQWITQATTNGLLLTRVLQAGTIAGFKGRLKVRARMRLK